jgi:hypothetical protein
MYLSDEAIKAAIDCGELIFDPPPDKIDPTSIDLGASPLGGPH